MGIHRIFGSWMASSGEDSCLGLDHRLPEHLDSQSARPGCGELWRAHGYAAVVLSVMGIGITGATVHPAASASCGRSALEVVSEDCGGFAAPVVIEALEDPELQMSHPEWSIIYKHGLVP